MAKALFFGLPVHGHVNPTLPLVRQLVRRGEAVVYFATEEFATQIANTGASYRPYRNAFLPELGAIARRMDELAWLFARTTSELLEQELNAYQAEKPDYVITDSVAPWGHWVGQILGVPVVTSVTTFAINRAVLRYAVSRGVRPQKVGFILSKLRHIARAIRLQREMRRTYHVPGTGMMPAMAPEGGLAIVYTSRAFQPRESTFDDRFCFVGPLLEPRSGTAEFPWERVNHSTIVYVSLGTLFNADESFYRSCFEALRDLDGQIILSVGGRVAMSSLGEPPPNVLVRAHVPQLEVLQRAAAFITHGGMNSVSESLYYGVPLVVIPQMSEQEVVGRRVEELGAGVFLAKNDVTPQSLRLAVDRVLASNRFRMQARTIGESFASAGGAARAVETIMERLRVSR